MASTKVMLKRSASIVDELDDVHHRVRERAYELFRTTNSSASPDENWRKAERELLWQPAVELCQKNDRLEVRAAVAGVAAKDLTITVTSEDLLITGNGAHAHRADSGTVHLCEFSHGHLFRPIHFPEPIDPTKVTAEYQDGLLTVTASLARSAVTTKAVKRKGHR